MLRLTQRRSLMSTVSVCAQAEHEPAMTSLCLHATDVCSILRVTKINNATFLGFNSASSNQFPAEGRRADARRSK